MDPGVTNTFAANGYEDLDKCFEIRIKDYALFDSPVPLQVWSQETYYTDCAQPPLLYEDGEFKRVEIFGRRENYMFPEPFGLGAGDLPRPRRGQHAAAPAAEEVRREGPALRRLQDGRRPRRASTPTSRSSARA